AAREALEEIGVTIKQADLKFVHVMHRMRKNDREYVDFYLMAETWTGEPHNAELNKADNAKWFSYDELPENIIPSVQEAIMQYRKGVTFSEFGADGRY